MASLTERTLKDHVGETYFNRGRVYANVGRVMEVNRAKDGRILGRVRGKQGTYVASMDIRGSNILRSSCTCPMISGCKHVAAIGILWCRQNGTSSAPAGSPSSVPASRQIGLKVAPKNPNLSRETTPWQRSIEQMVKGDADRGNPMHVYLQMKLEMPAGKGGAYRPRLEIRPRLVDDVRQWSSLTMVTWDNIKYQSSYNVPERELQFLRMLRNAILGQSYSYSRQWLHVRDDGADDAWAILRLAGEFDMRLVCGRKGEMTAVIAEEPIRATHIIDDGLKGSLTIRPVLTIGGEAIDRKFVLFIGLPPAFAMIQTVVPEYGTIMALHEAENIRSCAFGDDRSPLPITIPRRDRKKFVDEYLPRLSARVPVESKTADVAVPKLVTPKLSVAVSKAGDQSLRIALGYSYDGTILPLFHEEEFVRHPQGAYIVQENVERELFMLAKTFFGAQPAFQEELAGSTVLRSEGIVEGLEAASFIIDVIPLLKADDRIVVSADADLPPFAHAEHAPELRSSVEQTGDHDWFDLGLEVFFGKESVQLAVVLESLANAEQYVLLPSGTVVSLAHPTLAAMAALMKESASMLDTTKNGLKVSRFQAGLWQELKKLGIVSAQAEAWEESMQCLLEFDGLPPLVAPASITSILRPYQADGVRWLQFIAESGLGGVLADDMGLGKTLQMITLLLARAEKRGKDKKPSIVIAPTSVVESWETELRKFAPTLKSVILRAGDRDQHLSRLHRYDVIVTSYALLTRDHAALLKQDYDLLVIDEAQYVKNFQAKCYGLIRKIKARSRFALTGTPMENSTIELWSVLSIVAPGLFGGPEHFREHFQKPIEKRSDNEALTRLRSRVKPFLLRRTKEQVATELPPKVEQVLYLEMPPAQRKIYDLRLQRERQRVLGLLKDGGLKAHRFEVLESILRLRQLCLHPVLVDESHHDVPSVKLDALRDMLGPIVAEKHKVLVFSQFTSFLREAKKLLDAEGIEYLSLDGSTKDRRSLIDRFQSETGPPVFLISLKAGGVGLTLTAADYCILLDPWWNPAVEAQAVDRTHRIGQKKHVFVYRMIVKKTIEEKVFALQDRKRKLFKSVMDEGEIFASVLTEEDVKDLLS